MSRSPVARGYPWAATAKAPTRRYSAPSADKADNTSRKSGCRGMSLQEGPGRPSEIGHGVEGVGIWCIHVLAVGKQDLANGAGHLLHGGDSIRSAGSG